MSMCLDRRRGNVVVGNDGSAQFAAGVLTEINSTDPTDFGIDGNPATGNAITSGDGDNVVIGGSGSNTITLGALGSDVVIGANGEATLRPAV